MTLFYPAFLDVRDRRCLVFGGDREAEGKVMRLLRSGALVVVVSPTVTEPVAELADRGEIEWQRRLYKRGDLRGAFVAIAAPQVRASNAALWHEAEQEHVLLNAMDDTAHCHFIAPAIHEQGDIVVAVSTGGKAPALAVRLRDWIASAVDENHSALVDLLAELRPEMRRSIPDFDDRRELWYRMVDSEALDFLREGDVAAARGHLLGLLSHANARQHAVADGQERDG